MAEVEGSDIDWKMIGTYFGVGFGCLALGAFVVAPALKKWKAKKEDKSKQATASSK